MRSHFWIDLVIEPNQAELVRQEQIIQGIINSPDDPFIKRRTTQGQIDIGTRFGGAFGT